MAPHLPPVLHSDPKPSLEKASPLTPTEQLALRKHEMALERAEIQHQQDITLLKISLLRYETNLRMETEMELERLAENNREREIQENTGCFSLFRGLCFYI